MTKLAFTSLILLALAVACAAAFRLIGAEVDENGVLREAFPLLPLGYLFGGAGVITGALALFRRAMH